ncbi:MAG: choline dehydrogenase [Rhodoferax sp.]|nr:choline dehydrogenase [Rhodoferax sp.]
MNTPQTFDYLIIGAGSAGCVLANRLSADSSTTVCLIEAGPSDKSIFIKMPAALTFPIESDVYNWKYESEPEGELFGRSIGQAQGRGLGGSSSINGMVFVRGSEKDYDGWKDFGVKGWDYQDCLPFFKKMESFEAGVDPRRGGNGPLTVVRSEASHPLYKAFLEAGQEHGLADAGDYNSGNREGVHVTQASIRNGVRCSTSLAYLDPVKSRPNLTVMTGCHVEKILFDGKTAIGVKATRAGKTLELRAATEVILSAGAYGSPHLLMLSGIGERAQLAPFGIPVVSELNGVGANLQDHVVAPLRYRSVPGASVSRELNSTLGRLILGARWLLFKTGFGATNFFEVGAFFKSDADVDYYNMQHEFLPFLADFQSGKVHISDGFQYFVSQMRPYSRGSVKLRSADPRVHAAVSFNYLSVQRDTREMINGIRKTMDMANQGAWSRYRLDAVETPEPGATDTELAQWLRTVANTEHHPSGTCRMGTDAMAVTDQSGRVHGVQHLRVIDCSILPRVPSANINAPTIMVAEKIAAEMVAAHAKRQTKLEFA